MKHLGFHMPIFINLHIELTFTHGENSIIVSAVETGNKGENHLKAISVSLLSLRKLSYSFLVSFFKNDWTGMFFFLSSFNSYLHNSFHLLQGNDVSNCLCCFLIAMLPVWSLVKKVCFSIFFLLLICDQFVSFNKILLIVLIVTKWTNILRS